MPSFERGVYEPQSDDIHVFDEDEDIDEEGSRLPLLIVIALLVLAAFAGVVWLAYSQGVQRGRTDAPRMIVAAPGPDKEIASNSVSSNGAELKIYQQQAPVDEDTEASAPPPTRVIPSAPVVTPKSTQLVAAPPPAAIATPKPEAVKAAPVESPAVKPAPKLVIVEKPKPVVVAQKQPSSDAVTITSVAPVTAKPAALAGVGAYALQIGAYKSQSDADAAWKAYQAKHPIVGGYSEDVQQADLGAKGTWYRLRISSFSDKMAATALCDKLKADGGNCILAK
jgi:cell division protein FtsN